MADPSFVLKDATVENLRPLKVRVIGAGYSGIVAAIRIPQRLRNIDFVVYEKEEGIGGVWWLNKYPGIACDIPSHSYQFTFAPNPNWSSMYAPGREIQQYLQGVAEKFGATRFIQTSHKLESAAWDADKKQWRLEVLNLKSGQSFTEDCDVLITARGQLNNINWPKIDGLDTFKGKIMHSGAWNDDYDFKNKRVAVIGNGSSSIQIVPSLQKVDGIDLKVFMRSRTWISSGFGDNAMVRLGLDPTIVEFSEEQRKTWSEDPEAYFKLRKVIEDDGNVIHDSTILGSAMQTMFQSHFRAGMKERLASRPDIFDTIVPDFAPGCRRLTPGKGYLEALMAPNVEVLPEAVTAVSPDGVLTMASGRTLGGSVEDNNNNNDDKPIDALVLATGFKVSEPPPFPVTGRNGQTLAARWAKRPESYLSVAVDGFPNYLMMFGPNSAIGFGSLTKILEAECDYIVQVLRKLQREDYATIEPKAARVADFQQYIGRYFVDTVYLDHCRSWYRTEGGTGDWICGLWPGSTLHALEVLRSPRWEDFDYESADPSPNRLRWLGNGRSETQDPNGPGDPSWYINPDEVDVPREGKPEEEPRYKARPWSY
ncbi:Flavin monooxygenase-like protein [Niveomyces insectorum RCEF 264]|uniref:Flavin monooxygenase-like protein n=1 Tax=Niveomyces insectorum RCEF 264 TaxID=1081102 RepID=A0A162J690_9HYPO|nr:Flavin monooxygenase-like protein [Niveomyces insectorum RCEF 264]